MKGEILKIIHLLIFACDVIQKRHHSLGCTVFFFNIIAIEVENYLQNIEAETVKP